MLFLIFDCEGFYALICGFVRSRIFLCQKDEKMGWLSSGLDTLVGCNFANDWAASQHLV